MLTCKDMTRYATEFREGRMTAWNRFWYWLHRAMCPPCQAFEQQILQTAEAVRELGKRQEVADAAATPPPELLAKLREAREEPPEG